MRIPFLVSPLLLFATLCNPHSEAVASIVTYSNEAQFLAAAGNVSLESFEQLAPRTRSSDPISVSSFTLTPTPGLLGVQDGPNTPETGYGAFATDGTKYLFIYRPNETFGTLRFDLSGPTTAFGFNITDLGEIGGTLTLSSDTGESLTGLTVAQFPPLLPNGSQFFFGFTQTTPFTQVFLTSTGLIDDAFGLDEVYVQQVPLPSAVWLLVSGLIPLSLFGRQRNNRLG
jgi:hypothetical protein